MTNSLGHQPPPGPGTWVFDQSVADVFDDMLARSIPQYELMRAACFAIGKRFVQRGTAIIDLGASRGDAIEPFVREFGAANHYVLCELSAAMLDALASRFAGYQVERSGHGSSPIVDVRRTDLRVDYPATPASLTLAVLTLQFTPIEYRTTILERACANTVAGGAMVVVEKVLATSGVLHDAFVGVYHDHKHTAGYSRDEIARKALALEGVLVPVTAPTNEALLRGAGFARVECFWRWMNFAGWVAIK